MKSYNAGGIQGYGSNTKNYQTRIISNTVVINTGSTTVENVRFTFTGTNYTFEITWYEFCIYPGSYWTWWGDVGGFINSLGDYQGRFGATLYNQAGTVNGTGYFSSPTTKSLAFNSRTYSVSQNIASVYLAVHCDRWDLVTVTYG